ncbi:glycosyltransferase family 4 protein [Rhodospirillum rubrum]|uniref:Glycosyl transferase family 1 domain-containing protein n=1 Tax=Rhodospirillum rubrum (strain ATCC 11170 / ATH 1.1.1 / DSM 467 / LMG 4362 / NCIMB 8255 / S1) TaxID=269796 RepID=Q2RQ75_RHORT|nr:glycosyltransferase family 4 protein [Rhodospirillum rubrum]ABC23720.1 conserved hypothetical protein [Rhodospirillum rubrum ATCC 11170]AEO49459.1 hypothetical protein F11_14985 [Rhodospirillum rubrum F11]MBK5955396.1 hypothetical protein [Rhodospirillum rubrum]QXG79676.1 glycosyltransferase family 4 protein [Rhodospirillum rubrum]HAP98922.1 hypothetical protein [Rhodospirillum rubrum]
MKIGIGWQVGVPSGWGTYGLNLCLALARQGHRPVPLSLAQDLCLDGLTARTLAVALRDHAMAEKLLSLHGGLDLPHMVLHGLGDHLSFSSFADRVHGSPEVGVAFFESALIPSDNLARARDTALIVSGSSWNQMVLEAHGLTNARFCPQGIDPSLFHPAPRAGLLAPGAFVVFSGGKLEYRKGQDIVLAAFARFHARHPEALLVTAWHNLWPESLETLRESALVSSLPEIDGQGRLKIKAWAAAHGLPAEAVIDLGPLTNAQAPRLMREADLAVFANRCEGGTNLVAMEAMACGVPVALSANTGHLDLIAGSRQLGEPVCWEMRGQSAIAELSGDLGRTGWGETSVEEVTETMEAAYRDRDENRRRGSAGARFMAGWSWDTQVARLVDLLAEVEGRA